MYKTIGLLVYFIYALEFQNIFLCSSNQAVAQEVQGIPNIITRSEWDAREPKGPVSNLSENPPSYVVIHHSATEGCTSQESCAAKVRSMQSYHMDHNNWSDIGYNFLIGEDGNVYEGRGWSKCGAHAPKYNAKSIGICVIGTFTNRQPNSAAINALQSLISYGVTLGKIKSDYYLIGHRQASSTSCPGNKLYDLIQSWPHWRNNPSP